MRPYLLKKFRVRESDKLRAVPKEPFKRLREGISKLVQERGRKINLPHKPNCDFFQAVKSIFDDEIYDISLVEESGRLFLEASYCDMDSIYTVNLLETAGIDHIGNPALRQLVFDFVALFIKTNDLNAYDNTIWCMLMEEEARAVDEWDIPEDEKESIHSVISLMDKEAVATSAFSKRIKESYVMLNQLQERIEAFCPGDDRDTETLSLLKGGLNWVGYIPDLLQEDDTYGYSSVEVCSYDRFIYVTADHGVAPTCWSLIDGAFGGDVYYHELPVGIRINEDATISYSHDIEGFSLFMETLSEQLKKYIPNE